MIHVIDIGNTEMHLHIGTCIVGVAAARAVAQADDLNLAFAALNQARLLNGVKPLNWSPDLTAYAQLWVNMMASGQVRFEHATGPYRPGQGEVLYVQTAGQCDVSYDIPFQSAMHAWLSQGPLYDGKPITTGHEPWLHWCKWAAKATQWRDEG